DIIQASRDLDNRAEIVQGGRDDGDDDDDDSYDFGDEDDVNTDLSRILAAADGTLMDAYTSCSETSPDGKMTRQRALRLSNFRGGEDNMSSAKASKFREFKNGKSLKSYFRIAKQLLVYYYRVVFRDDGHFTRESNDQVLPGDVVEATSWQKKAMQGIINALRRQDKTSRVRSGGGGDEERDVELKHAIRTFYISLICHTVGSRRFRSAVLSFCAMLSRRKNPTRQRDNEQRMLCTWHKPGNFNSNLSSLIWVAQVILFDFVCFKKQDDEDGIPDLIDEICGRYFQQMAETPFGHILQWRLYLFAASSTNLTEHQARWSLDKETIDYRGVELHMDHVSQLVVSEFHQAHTLLYEELLFGMGDIAPIGAWRLHDDLDQDDFGASWLSDERNREVLAGTHDALLRQVEGKAALRRVFVRPDQNHDDSGETRLCPNAMAIYEAHVQEFLRRMLTLKSSTHVTDPPGNRPICKTQKIHRSIYNILTQLCQINS
ncbi:hypothetical protein IWW34DRAFT_639685, partial [Fusarium oxysporum f. sp. albedinis]